MRRRPVRPRPNRNRPTFRRPPQHPRAARALKLLRRANHMMETGHFIEASNIYLELARRAEDRSIPRSPQLYLQAGRALSLAGEIDNAVTRLRKGLQLMLDYQQGQRFQFAIQRVVQDLQRQGFENHANELEEEFSESIKELPKSQDSTQTEHPPLPPSCPDCGAVVRPDELEWINSTQAYCDYCGSVLEGR